MFFNFSFSYSQHYYHVLCSEWCCGKSFQQFSCLIFPPGCCWCCDCMFFIPPVHDSLELKTFPYTWGHWQGTQNIHHSNPGQIVWGKWRRENERKQEVEKKFNSDFCPMNNYNYIICLFSVRRFIMFHFHHCVYPLFGILLDIIIIIIVLASAIRLYRQKFNVEISIGTSLYSSNINRSVRIYSVNFLIACEVPDDDDDAARLRTMAWEIERIE